MVDTLELYALPLFDTHRKLFGVDWINRVIGGKVLLGATRVLVELGKSTCSSKHLDRRFGVDLLNFSVHFVYSIFIKCILI